MSDEYGADLVSVVDDEGNRHEFELVDAIETDDGRYVALAVFLCNSLESPETNLSLIKDITRLSVDWLARQPMLLQGGTARP